MLSTSIGRLRATGLVEGVSYLLLLAVAMPLKYMADMPEAVTLVGSIHGGLFLLFCVALLRAWVDRQWPFTRVLWVFAAAVLPFGPFVIDGRLKAEDEASP